jgi:hypothetical protein
MKLIFCEYDSTTTPGLFTPFNHHLLKITRDLTLQPGEICICILETQTDSSMVFLRVLLDPDNVTFYPTQKAHRASMTIYNHTNNTIRAFKNDSLATITLLKNVNFTFGFVAEYDLKRYICHHIQNS